MSYSITGEQIKLQMSSTIVKLSLILLVTCLIHFYVSNDKPCGNTDFPVLISGFSPISHRLDSLCLTALLCTAAHCTFAFICLANHNKPSFFPQRLIQYKGHLGTWYPLSFCGQKSNATFRRRLAQSWPHLRPLLSVLTVGCQSGDWSPSIQLLYICLQLALYTSPLGSCELKAMCEFPLPCSWLL